MRLAILGASSHIAKDLIASIPSTTYQCTLFVRASSTLDAELQETAARKGFAVVTYDSFDDSDQFDAIINFVGVGDPARALQMGQAIFTVTEHYDNLALAYLRSHPECKYIYLSSGAAYGSNFAAPVTETSTAVFPINALLPQHWYGAAKFQTECRHRALPDAAIVDVRVFSYFSHRQAREARFFLSDILRALHAGTVLEVAPDDMLRDYLTPADFMQLIDRILQAPACNSAVDCYSLAPVGKFELLAALGEQFGLNFTIVGEQSQVNATGQKAHYYSYNRKAEQLFGYVPTDSSLSGVMHEIRQALHAED
ncbi:MULTISPECIES: NAD-dependent epimerase/dehydratase family protein [Yersinia]|uniref:NAD-dependent epimerase/dehydratase family protein n=1 Tax=Yersinia TaxID=629 RepID=UPI0005E16BAA|nr:MULTISPECIES: NAD(P)-dependent oxidoreductase [Yersinia]MDN0102340.1 NAD(P)-dependent oxidoreductase [Yersinia bercovieri]QDW33069.1 NAD(P)-dependent oxidoreductase [Yersinia sp. KBS0713]CNF40012.1 NAD dependent epimerase/dehydratase family [Yersinia bercovieri]CNI43517.1 NAD dependent epimerase/dehydratase family [Yersinia bercovieri]